jgi:hypothetical protein
MIKLIFINMKQFILFFAIILIAASCKKDKSDMNEAAIIGADMTMCACCGGYFIDINNTRYRFNPDSVTSSLNLNTATFPLDVDLEWVSIVGPCDNFNWSTIQSIRRR